MPSFTFHVEHYFISQEIFYTIFYVPRETLFYFPGNILCHFLCFTWNITLFPRKYFIPFFMFHVKHYFISREIFYAIFYVSRETLFYFPGNILCHFLCSTWNIILFPGKYFMPFFMFHVEHYFIFWEIFYAIFYVSRGTLLIFLKYFNFL